MKKDAIKKDFKLMYLVIICITIVLSVGIFSYSNYQKEQLKQEQENNRLQNNQNKLTICISQAKNNRTNLWNNNCTKQSNGSCTINNSKTIEWIEQRYQQDLNNCYQLYGN